MARQRETAWWSAFRMKLPKRLRRFSLRTFMVLVAILAAWLAYQARQESQRRQLAHAIELAGGSVSTDIPSMFTMFPMKGVSSVSIPYWSFDEFSDADLRIFGNLTEIVILDFQCDFPPPDKDSTAKPSIMAGMAGMTSERLSVSSKAEKLLRKIRDRQIPISLEEVMAGAPEK